MASHISLPPLPNNFKPVGHLLKTAHEHETRDAVVTYWARLDIQRLVESIWHSMFQEKCPDVVCFGSRDYGLATQSSDWDYALEIHEHL